MKLSQFKFKLPEEKIAQYPAPHRDECRMMVLHRKTGDIEHLMFKDLLTFFDEEGNELKSWDICLSAQGEITVEEAPDGKWYRKMEYSFIEVNPSLPDEITLAYITEDGFRIDMPISLK